MKRLTAAILLLALLCCVGCSRTPATPESTAAPVTELPEYGIPQDLPGVWSSADAGKLMMSETITFGEDGSLSVSGVYEGSDMGTIYGTYRVMGNTIFCDITEGATPFKVSYAFRVDGRELVLTDDDGDAHYLRTS
ncbi:MAG: hypothetical protein IJG45_02110 [Oscillospiraceae bacterium]|nr:hypothetical protein [Oscillospiraceae bacterium]